ncbi:protein adenylyltransferase SelO [Anaerosacchariphilus polymeriproducens]|uniref:Protein nucleotidyltransferase YdiU n=1 Tax=Anaerosacchariphilus polymeriproducens TaxID=1812858 RepID=A0A371ATM1_9FIRM|nr:YdiU family protein [Anaerosacchariphilus polymeriproducens]RDU22923.1 YdiU family protein [Anaerosacchariphilus polymeriproducens]
MEEQIKKNNPGWNFDNSYLRLPDTFYSFNDLNPVNSPKMIKLNESLAKDLGLDPNLLKNKESVSIFAGNQVPEGATPIAQAYAGHQFGYFTMLGDGRALLLGEHITPSGERFDVQLKGSGITKYSRRGDGRAVLGPMLREYIISEAMYALGIPTTRSLAVVTTGEKVMRETILPGAVLTRIASSHIRVGTFEFAAQWEIYENLKALADYTIKRHYPELLSEENRYISFLREVVKRQAELIAKWQLIGFIHGVMNTDNVSISGETIDYGPCAFMDIYDPATVFSSIDTQGRYAYGNQPIIAVWNLSRFAETLIPLIDEEQKKAIEMAENTVSDFTKIFRQNWMDGMRAKLGLFSEEGEDEALIEELLNIMLKNKADYTNTFRSLTLGILDEFELNGVEEFMQWKDRWSKRLESQSETKEDVLALMKKSNPSVIPRNHHVEAALDAAQNNDFSLMEKLLHVLESPFAYTEEQNEYVKVPERKTCYLTYCGT